jgi:orotidine-5'-phosphate decarboxylase
MTRVSDLTPFQKRIAERSRQKNSRIVLSLDPTPGHDPKKFALKSIDRLYRHVCAVKLNFHLILPLSVSDLTEITELAHARGLECIADIKLNDIGNTNHIAIRYLLEMGFDAVIVNPLIGKVALNSAVKQTHERDCGIITLTYMSHAGAREYYGAEVINHRTGRIARLYKMFLSLAIDVKADGIVIGANQSDILKEISNLRKIPIFSPGIGIQGGRIALAIKNGTDYFIVGRSIIASANPIRAAKRFQQLAVPYNSNFKI